MPGDFAAPLRRLPEALDHCGGASRIHRIAIPDGGTLGFRRLLIKRTRAALPDVYSGLSAGLQNVSTQGRSSTSVLQAERGCFSTLM